MRHELCVGLFCRSYSNKQVYVLICYTLVLPLIKAGEASKFPAVTIHVLSGTQAKQEWELRDEP